MSAARTPISPAGEQYLLDRDIVFLNHGSFGARPSPVFEAYQRWQRELEREPLAFLGRELHDRLAHARACLAAYVGTEPDDLVFVPNVTHGMNIVARSLALGPGDEVLGSTHEYGAVERTWTFLASRDGFSYRSQHIPTPVTDADSFIECLWRGVGDRTRAMVVSHITSPTALILPLAEICRRAAAAGILVIVDGAHGPGQIPLNLSDLGADFYLGNCHKWLSAPVGSGFLYARPEHQNRLLPLVVSWGYQPRTPSTSRFQDYFEWIGTDDPSAYLAVPAAIEFQQQNDWDTVRAECHQLVVDACVRACHVTGLPPLSPLSPEWVGQMVAIPLPKQDTTTAEELQHRLLEGYRIEIPITDWQEVRCARLSLQAYNSAADVELLLKALRASCI
jgi:isopenicillin-N epimerase